MPLYQGCWPRVNLAFLSLGPLRHPKELVLLKWATSPNHAAGNICHHSCVVELIGQQPLQQLVVPRVILYHCLTLLASVCGFILGKYFNCCALCLRFFKSQLGQVLLECSVMLPKFRCSLLQLCCWAEIRSSWPSNCFANLLLIITPIILHVW